MPGASLADRRINATIATGSGMFVFGLAISAAFVPELRVLHFFSGAHHIAVVAMTRRKSAMGFGAGLAVPVFWNALSVFVTGDARDGKRELGTLARKGQTQHPDVPVSLFAFCGHLLIIIGCTAGFIRIRPSACQWAHLLVGGVIALSYLITTVFVFGTPQAVDLMKHIFGG
jgi:hypothetical protein